MPELVTLPVASAETALLAVRDGALLLDVREPHEWAAGHAITATHIPLGQVADRVGELPTDPTVFVVCRSGARSERAAAFLVERGFDAVNVEGGMLSWHAAGFAVVDDSGAPGTVA